MFQAVKESGGLSNAMESSRVTYPGSFDEAGVTDAGGKVGDANNVDYIYHKKLTGVLAGTVNDEKKIQVPFDPVFSAFIFQ